MTTASTDNNVPRYSVYFAPAEDSELAEFGRKALQSEPLQNDHPARIEMTRKAAHYGFHATFKAPMELAAGLNETHLLDAVKSFVQTKKAVKLTGLGPQVLNGFHALMLPPCEAVDKFAADTMTSFDRFRAPLSEADRVRRNPDQLSQRQRDYLERYGYPHVLDDFHFHMTLSQQLNDSAKSASYHTWLTELYGDTITQTPWLDRLAVFWQPDRATAFTRLAEFPVN